ncbi:hypothetical protein JXB28_02505 [Candidatus Woesearchaeota archaeon]|nr:hypothetical protein [Candidatus Woesearchaeota archaeon]
MKKRGRPVGSSIRQNLIEILYHRGKAYGYDLYRDYCAIFPKVTLRVIYYHLKKGVALGEFILETVKLEKGNYSWGDAAEKKYYKLGTGVKPRLDKRVRDYFSKKSFPKKR